MINSHVPTLPAKLKKMNIQHYKTKNVVLRKYIDGYYFMVKAESKLPFQYLSFPSNLYFVTTTQNSSVKIGEERIIVTPSKGKKIVTDLVVRYTKPFKILYQEPANEITIKFKPLGLNRFVANLSDYFSNEFYMDFQPFDDLNMEMQSIFGIVNRNEQIERLESYWLSKFKNVELDRLENIVADLEGDQGIAEISKKHQISRQYHIEYLPSKSISDLVKRLKGRTSRRIQEEFPHISKRYWGRHFWAIGYGVWSTGNITDEMVQKYLEHHRTTNNTDKDNIILE